MFADCSPVVRTTTGEQLANNRKTTTGALNNHGWLFVLVRRLCWLCGCSDCCEHPAPVVVSYFPNCLAVVSSTVLIIQLFCWLPRVSAKHCMSKATLTHLKEKRFLSPAFIPSVIVTFMSSVKSYSTSKLPASAYNVGVCCILMPDSHPQSQRLRTTEAG